EANVDEQLAAVAHIGWIQLLIAFHEEGLLRRPAKEHAIAPRARQERLDVTLDARPQVGIVRLEDDPLRTAFDGRLNVVEKTADVHVAPGRIAAQRARAPDPQAAAGERADAVHPDRVQGILLALGNHLCRLQRAPNDLVGGRFMHATLGIAPRIDAREMSAWRHGEWPAVGAGDLHPRIV